MEVLTAKIAAVLSGKKSADGVPLSPTPGPKPVKMRRDDGTKMVVMNDVVDKIKGDMDDVGSASGGPGLKGRDHASPKAISSGARKKILVVDEDAAAFPALQAVFSVYDYETWKAGTFDECLEKARSGSPPDLIVLKNEMHGKSAEEFADAFKQIPQVRSIPIVIYEDIREKSGVSPGSVGFKLNEEGKELLKRVRELLC